MTAQKPSGVLLKVLGQVLVTCDMCTQLVRCVDVKAHVESGCTCNKDGLPGLTVSQILNQPLTTAPTSTERQLASNLVRRMMVTSPTDSIQIATGGQVINYHLATPIIILAL